MKNILLTIAVILLMPVILWNVWVMDGNKDYMDEKKTFYEWMLEHFPRWLMWKKIKIDTQHTMWKPRFGYSKRSVKWAKKRAKELSEKLKWD